MGASARGGILMIEFLRGTIAILFVFSFAIFIHELGHFMFAKLFGVFVETFSIGFGRKLWHRKWGETEYAISAIPFGGYVKLRGMHSKEMEEIFEKEDEKKKAGEEQIPEERPEAGEPVLEEVAMVHRPHAAPSPEALQAAPTESDKKALAGLSGSVMDEMNALRAKPFWQKFLILSAGCINNLLTAVIVYFLLAWIGYKKAEPEPAIIDRIDDQYAAVIPLQAGDRITKVSGQEVDAFYEDFLKTFAGEAQKAGNGTVPVEVERNGERLQVELPARMPPDFWRPGEELVNIGGVAVRNFEDVLRLTDKIPKEKETVEIKTQIVQPKMLTRDAPRIAAFGPWWPFDALDPFAIPYVGVPQPNLPADRAGMEAGDIITSIDGKPVKSRVEATQVLRGLPEREVPITVLREGKDDKMQTVNLTVSVRHDPELKGQGQIGIYWAMPRTSLHKLPFLEAVKEGFTLTGRMVMAYLRGLRMLLGSSWQTIRENLGGPIAIGTMTVKAAERGALWFFNWVATFNVILAVTNLLPIPILDGGHIVFAAIEAVIRRPLPARAMLAINYLFLVLLIGLALLITLNDVIMNFWRLF